VDFFTAGLTFAGIPRTDGAEAARLAAGAANEAGVVIAMRPVPMPPSVDAAMFTAGRLGDAFGAFIRGSGPARTR
jgi:hypothetical protein